MATFSITSLTLEKIKATYEGNNGNAAAKAIVAITYFDDSTESWGGWTTRWTFTCTPSTTADFTWDFQANMSSLAPSNIKCIGYVQIYNDNEILIDTCYSNEAVSVSPQSSQLSVWSSSTYQYIRIAVYNLQYLISHYSYIKIGFYQDDVCVYATAIYIDKLQNYEVIVYGRDYYNLFTPGGTYIVKATAIYNGREYTVGDDVIMTLPNISAPPSSLVITPSVYPSVYDQGTANTCTPCASVTALEIIHSRAKGVAESYVNYDPTFLYGSDTKTPDEEGMKFAEACRIMKEVGAPRWELINHRWNYQCTKSNARSIVNAAGADMFTNASAQCISGYTLIDFYDWQSVYDGLQETGVVLLALKTSDALDNPSNGVVSSRPTSQRGWHFLAIIGSTWMNNKLYWIFQNSWGTSYGVGGRGYIPWDYGIGCKGTAYDGSCPAWVGECYRLHDTSVPTIHPITPIISNVVRTGQSSDGSVLYTVTFVTQPGSRCFIFVQPVGDDRWYAKGANGSTQFGVAYNSPVTITLNNTMQFRVSIIAISDATKLCSLRSDIYDMTTRPDDWVWVSTVEKDQPLAMTAQEWMDFAERIEEFYTYSGQTIDTSIRNKMITGVVQGNQMKALQGSSARTLIYNLLNSLSLSMNELPGDVVTGDKITASFFNGLKDALNSIP